MTLSKNDFILKEYTNHNNFPPTICIQLLNWCNLKCNSCRSNSSARMNDSLEFDRLTKILKELRDYGNWRISLTGGEPFFWPQINELLSLLYQLNFHFSITTNGFASKNLFDKVEPSIWDKCTLYVSIDGNADTHNNLRGDNSFENAINFIKYTRPKVRNLFVNTVLFTNPEEWAEFLYNELVILGINNWTIISPVKQGRWNNGNQEGTDFRQQYELIKSIANGHTSTTFLDFSETDSKIADVVFFDSNGSVRLPGALNDNSIHTLPKSRIINIEDKNLVEEIVLSVNSFIESDYKML